MHRTIRFASLPILLATLVRSAAAGGPEPGSLLIFPEYDNRRGEATYLTLTNTSSTQSVRVHLNLVNAANCLISNRTITLTPRDTYTALTSSIAAPNSRGYVWAFAQSTTNGQAIDFDELIGSALRIDAVEGVDYSVPPFVFRGLTGHGNPTDVDADGKRDLNGVEYELAPSRIQIPRFFGQANEPLPPNAYASDLVLLQPLASPGVTTTVAFLLFNDNEEVFSAQTEFTCWSRQRLLSINGAFANWFLQSTNDNPLEIVGQTALESGWLEARGQIAIGPGSQQLVNPPILGLVIDIRPTAGADLPFLDR